MAATFLPIKKLLLNILRHLDFFQLESLLENVLISNRNRIASDAVVDNNDDIGSIEYDDPGENEAPEQKPEPSGANRGEPEDFEPVYQQPDDFFEYDYPEFSQLLMDIAPEGQGSPSIPSTMLEPEELEAPEFRRLTKKKRKRGGRISKKSGASPGSTWAPGPEAGAKLSIEGADIFSGLLHANAASLGRAEQQKVLGQAIMKLRILEAGLLRRFGERLRVNPQEMSMNPLWVKMMKLRSLLHELMQMVKARKRGLDATRM